MSISVNEFMSAAAMSVGPCLEAPGVKDHQGYGRSHTRRFGKMIRRAHILAWVDHHGRLPAPGMCILHHCDNPPCHNVKHLYEGTRSDNNRDMVIRSRFAGKNQNSDKTVCINGHPYTPDNTYRRHDGHRQCVPCNRVSAREYQRRRRAAQRVAS